MFYRRNGFRYAVQLLCWEGAFALAYETLIGPTYLSGVAGELGVSIGLVSLMAAVPWIGSFGQLGGLWLYHRAPCVKNYTLTLATCARTLWAIPVALAWIFGVRNYLQGQPFPADLWFRITIGIACLAALIGSASGGPWMSWVKETVPERVRGRFFGMRVRYTMSAVIVAHAVGSAWIGWKPGGYHLGFGLLLIIAVVCAALSTTILSRVPAPRSNPDCPKTSSSPIGLAAILEPLRDRKFRGIIAFGALFNGAIQLAGPYFPYYFTRELHLPMSRIVLWTGLTHLGWLLASVAWGRVIDRSGRKGGLPAAFWITAHLIALSPIFYISTSMAWINWIGPLDYLTNGMAWAGYNLFFTTTLMAAAPRGRTLVYCSVSSAAAGLMGAAGNLLGARLAIWLAPWGGFRALWCIATAARLAVIWGLYPYLSPRKIKETESSRTPSEAVEAAEAVV